MNIEVIRGVESNMNEPKEEEIITDDNLQGAFSNNVEESSYSSPAN